MARIAGVNIPTQKRVEIGLTYIRGVGRGRKNLLPLKGSRRYKSGFEPSGIQRA